MALKHILNLERTRSRGCVQIVVVWSSVGDSSTDNNDISVRSVGGDSSTDNNDISVRRENIAAAGLRLDLCPIGCSS